MIAAALSALLLASAKGAVAVAAVLAVRAVFGRRLPPRWIVALWLIVAARLLLPVGPASAWSLFGGETLTGVSRLGPWIGSAATAGRTGPADADQATSGAGSAALLRRVAHRAGEILSPSPAVAGPLALLWAAGALVLLAREMRDRRRLAGLRAGARPIDDPAALRHLDGCRRALGLRRDVELAESAGVAGAALCPGGPGTPALVLLAPGAASRLAPARLRHVLLHELAHLAHGDLAARRIARALCALHWFNPLVHLAARTLAADQEVAADARAMAALGRAERGDYGATLLALLPRSPAPARAAPVAFSTTRRQLHRRLAMIAGFRHRRRGPALAFAAAALPLLAAVLLTDGAAAGTARQDAPGAQAAQAAATPPEPAGDALGLQARALDEIRSIGRAMFAWSEDHPGPTAFAAQGEDAPFDWSRCPAIAHRELAALLVPRYAETLPEVDPWGRPYDLCLDREGSASTYRIGVRTAGSDKRVDDGSYLGGPFTPDRTTEDVVWIDGFFVRWPEKDAEPPVL